MAFADYTSQGRVAVITLENPPVNALSLGLRKAIADGVERAANDASIRAIVIVGSGNAFCGGADVSEFGRPVMAASPSLWDLFSLVDDSLTQQMAHVGKKNLVKTSGENVVTEKLHRQIRRADERPQHP